MKKIETQIRHLKKDNEEIEERIKQREKNHRKSIEDKKTKLKKLETVKAEYLRIFKEYSRHKKIEREIYKEKKMILDKFNSKRFIFKKVMYEIDYPDGIEERSKENQKYLDGIFKYERELKNELRDLSFTLSKKTQLYNGIDVIKNDFNMEISLIKKSINNSIDYFDNRDLKSKYEKNKKKIERLERRQRSQKKQRSLANAYLKKNRLDASTVKSRLKYLDICPYCGNEVEELEADHIYPVSSGGLSIDENMVNVCKPCNRNKGHLTLRQFIKRYDLDRDYIENRLDELGKRF